MSRAVTQASSYWTLGRRSALRSNDGRFALVLSTYAERLSRLDGVARVEALTGSFAAGRQLAGWPGGGPLRRAAAARFAGPNGTWL